MDFRFVIKVGRVLDVSNKGVLEYALIFCQVRYLATNAMEMDSVRMVNVFATMVLEEMIVLKSNSAKIIVVQQKILLLDSASNIILIHNVDVLQIKKEDLTTVL